MPASEFREWMEYERLEPFGQWRDNWHTSIIASVLANAHRKPNTPPVKMTEFFYVDPDTSREKSDDELFALLMSASTEREH